MFFPSLSPDGWIDDPENIADKMFSHFLVAEAAQTQIYMGNVMSYAECVAKGQGSVDEVIRIMHTSLQIYFERMFSNVSVSVVDVTDTTDPGKIVLGIEIQFTDNKGVQHTLSSAVEGLNAKTPKVIKFNQ